MAIAGEVRPDRGHFNGGMADRAAHNAPHLSHVRHRPCHFCVLLFSCHLLLPFSTKPKAIPFWVATSLHDYAIGVRVGPRSPHDIARDAVFSFAPHLGSSQR